MEISVLVPIYSSCMPCEKRATSQIAHLVFANTQANAEKPKELFFANAPIIMRIEIFL